MKIEIVDFRGYIKWMVTSEIIFVDPLFHLELLEAMKIQDFK